MKTLDEITPDTGFLQAILNAIPSGIFVTDREHNTLLINNGGAALAGRSAGDCFDRKCYDVFDTFICKTDFCNCRLAAHNDAAQHGVTIMRLNGKELPIEYVGHPLKNFAGEIVGCVEHFTDITDRLAKKKPSPISMSRCCAFSKKKQLRIGAGPGKRRSAPVDPRP